MAAHRLAHVCYKRSHYHAAPTSCSMAAHLEGSGTCDSRYSHSSGRCPYYRSLQHFHRRASCARARVAHECRPRTHKRPARAIDHTVDRAHTGTARTDCMCPSAHIWGARRHLRGCTLAPCHAVRTRVAFCRERRRSQALTRIALAPCRHSDVGHRRSRA